MITYCDVIPNCTDCPRYGDDCDDDKRVEHTDLISRADGRVSGMGTLHSKQFCGATIEDKSSRSWDYNYCPSCGANMVKGGAI